MSEFDKQTPMGPTSVAGHEPDQVSVRGVLATVAGLVLMVLVVLGLMAGLTAWNVGRSEPEQARTEKSFSSDISGQYAPLDVDQPQQLHELRAAEQRQLTSYGWTNHAQQIAHIPIERAMQLMAEKGLDDIPIVQSPASAQEKTPQDLEQSPQPPAEE